MTKLTTIIKDKISGKVPLFKRRSSRWSSVRAAFLAKNGSCAACGQTDHLQVHHIIPFNVDPTKELDESNLITLCEDEYDCHRIIGHTGNFRKVNPNVREDANLELAKHMASHEALSNQTCYNKQDPCVGDSTCAKHESSHLQAKMGTCNRCVSSQSSCSCNRV